MTFQESTEIITSIACLQNELLDHSGHVTRGLPRDRARTLVETIQSLRESVGWKPLVMTGRWRRTALV